MTIRSTSTLTELYYIQVEEVPICFSLDHNKLEMSQSKLRFQDEQVE